MRRPDSGRPLRRSRHRRLRIVIDVAIVLLLLLAGAAGALYWYLRSVEPQARGTLVLAALHAPAEVVRDSRGVPHIRAGDIHDALVAEGYSMAQDRLWQMDLLRRVAEGRLAEVFGVRAVPLDRVSRMLGLSRMATAGAATLDPSDRAALDAFCAGVNLFIVTRGWRLPLEFRILQYRPSLWRGQDTLAIAAYMYEQLASGYQYKIERENFQAALGPALMLQAFPDRSPWDIVPGTPPPSFGAPAGPSLQAPLAERGSGIAMALAEVAALIGPSAPPAGLGTGTANAAPARGGSNAWVLAPERTVTGRPILANDPHLEYAVPDLWWAVELSAPGLNVAGVALAGAPGVILGHNDAIAWGATDAGADTQDLYRESVDSKGNVLTPHGWRPLQRWHEVIHVRHGADVVVEVPVTPHGPIVAADAGGPLALRWTLYSPGALRLIASFLAIDQATDWSDFERALAGYPGPPMNFMYADRAGHIGYQLAGWVPLRPAHDDGALPVPGATDAHEWRGWVPFDQLPHVVDPAAGMLVTANGRVSPDDAKNTISTNWEAPNRTRRIYELLGQRRRWDASAMSPMQMDVFSEQDRDFAATLVAAAAAVTASGRVLDAPARAAVGLLRGFNGVMAHTSLAPSLVVATRYEMLDRVLAAHAGPELARAYQWDEAPVFAQYLVRERPGDWLPAAEHNAGWDGFLIDCLSTVARRYSLQHAPLHWGRFETLFVQHPLYSRIFLLRDYADLGPVEIDGSPITVKQARSVRLGDAANLGPSMRAVYDLADWDASTLTLLSGESGELFNPHYRDQFSAYLRGQPLPLWFSPAAVAAHAASRLHLLP